MIEPYYSENGFTIYNADCRVALPDLPDSSVDSCVTDPPYELGFMGKSWDRSGIAYNVGVWREVLRVLKPGAHLLAFGGSRTYHRLACAIEDAGLEIRDQIQWLYGSGFPKSLDVSKAIDAAAGAEREAVGTVRRWGNGAAKGRGGQYANDYEPTTIGAEKFDAVTAPATDAAKQWNGWGTALKPAHEPIVLARKPLIGTVAENVLAHGTGGLNVDDCRIEASGRPLLEVHALRKGVDYAGNSLAGRLDGSLQSSKAIGSTDLGRWPANVIHDGSDEVLAVFPDAPGQQRYVGPEHGERPSRGIYGDFGARPSNEPRNDFGSAARFFYCAKASQEDREEGLEDFQLRQRDESRKEGNPGGDNPRNRGLSLRANHHPTVKPTDLMRYLVRLITPLGGTVLDPFAGSGSTGKACALEGMNVILIEKEIEYCELAMRRARLRQTIFNFATA